MTDASSQHVRTSVWWSLVPPADFAAHLNCVGIDSTTARLLMLRLQSACTMGSPSTVIITPWHLGRELYPLFSACFYRPMTLSFYLARCRHSCVCMCHFLAPSNRPYGDGGNLIQHPLLITIAGN